MITEKESSTSKTSLPFIDIIWWRVFSYLDLHHKNILSQTCKRLHSIFLHPNLWKDAAVFLKVKNTYSEKEKRKMNEQQKLFLEFGKHVRKLAIELTGLTESSNEPVDELLALLLQKCFLVKDLSINVKLAALNKNSSASYTRPLQRLSQYLSEVSPSRLSLHCLPAEGFLIVIL